MPKQAMRLQSPVARCPAVSPTSAYDKRGRPESRARGEVRVGASRRTGLTGVGDAVTVGSGLHGAGVFVYAKIAQTNTRHAMTKSKTPTTTQPFPTSMERGRESAGHAGFGRDPDSLSEAVGTGASLCNPSGLVLASDGWGPPSSRGSVG